MDFDNLLEVITPTKTTSIVISATGGLSLPSGSTALRPVTPPNGTIRYNSDTSTFEYYSNTAWISQAGNINSARTAATGNVTLTAPGATMDGITLVSGNRVLLWQQTTASQNGIYIWTGAAATLTRATDMSSNWDVTVPGRNVQVEEGTIYDGFTFFAVSPTGGTYDTTDMVWSGDFFQVGKILFGNSATVTRASTGGFGQRNFTLLDTNASLRTWRFLASTSGNSAGLEMVIGNNDDLANAANFWWDISANSDTQEAVRIARRTGGVIAPKLIVDLNGRMTVGNAVLAGGATGAAFASTAGIVTYFNSLDAIRLPNGATTDRPTITAGLLRFNTTTARLEYATASAWVPVTYGFSTPQIISGAFTANTGTSSIPYDGTTPLSTEGTLVWTQAITPSSTASTVKIDISTNFGFSTGNAKVILALFRGTTCIGTRVLDLTVSGVALAVTVGSSPVNINMIDSPASAAAVTYTLRIGATSGAWFFGRTAQTLNGTAAGNFILSEIL